MKLCQEVKYGIRYFKSEIGNWNHMVTFNGGEKNNIYSLTLPVEQL